MSARRAVSEVVFVVLVGGAIAGIGWGLLATAAYRARLAFCIAVGLAIAATWRLVGATRPDVEPPAPQPADPEAESRSFPELYALEHRLSWGSVDAERFETRVRPQLVRLADERLRQRHGVERWRQPDRARRIVGEPLWLLMTGPPTVHPPSPEHLAELVTQLERI